MEHKYRLPKQSLLFLFQYTRNYQKIQNGYQYLNFEVNKNPL